MPPNKQILAITSKIKANKVKDKGKAIKKVQEIKAKEAVQNWLGQ